MWENHGRQTFSSLRREMPLSLWVKSLKAFAGCGILKNSAITKADGFVREHLRNRGKEMEQKGTELQNQVLTSLPVLAMCRSQWTTATLEAKQE